MWGLLLFILVFVLVFFIISAGIVTSLITQIFRFIGRIFGFGLNNNNPRRNSKHTQANSQPEPKKKIFSKDDGEYVDFEEEP